MPVTVAVVSGPEFDRVGDALDREDDLLPSRTHKTLRDATKKLAGEAASKVRVLQIRGRSGKHTGLRQRVAAGVHVTGAGGLYRIGTSMPKGQEIIPRGLDRASGWTHPVFGSSWTVRQTPVRTGWFTGTISDGEPSITRALEDNLEDSAGRIAAAGFGP
jgi:hypothetical protein